MAPMTATGPAQTGFTLIELVVSIALIGILYGLLLSRITFYQEQAEKASMELIVSSIRSALHLEAAKLYVKGRSNEIQNLTKMNPMNWMQERPNNYLGEFYDPSEKDVVSGNWYFDLHSRNLIYLVRRTEHLSIGQGEGSEIRFHVKVLHGNASTKLSVEKADSEIEGVVFEQVVPYKWF